VVAGASVCNIVANGSEYFDGVNAAYPIYLDGAVECISTGSYWLKLWTQNEAPTNLFSTGTINNRAENIFTTQGSAITLTLPNALAKWGKNICIKNLGTGVVTVTRQGSDTIDGLVSVGIPANGTLSLMLKGTVWQIISRDVVTVTTVETNEFGAYGGTPRQGTSGIALDANATYQITASVYQAAGNAGLTYLSANIANTAATLTVESWGCIGRTYSFQNCIATDAMFVTLCTPRTTTTAETIYLNYQVNATTATSARTYCSMTATRIK
jgi:hypothetical protein